MSGASVRSSGTLPERRVQGAARSLGVTFRCNASDLPGSPDLVFDELGCIVFVHGCFWHLHRGCPRMRIPHNTERRGYWYEKLARNALRDDRVERELLGVGWRVLVVWECETTPRDALTERLAEFLGVRVPKGQGGNRRSRRRR